MSRKSKTYVTETIDKITIVLNPWLINNDMRRKIHIDPFNRLTLHSFGSMVGLAIHWEWINHRLSVYENIALALLELVKREYIVFPYNDFTLPFIIKYLPIFVWYVQQIEFAFDFLPSDIKVNEDAVRNGNLIQYRDYETKELTDNYYTPDYHDGKRKSIGIIYDKEKKDIHDRKKR